MASFSTTAAPVSQLSCFSSINRRFLLQKRSLVSFPHSRTQIVMRVEGPGTESTQPSSHSASDPVVLSSSTEGAATGTSEPIIEQKRSAKIHDFCLGIPFGGLVLGGGIVGSILSGNVKVLSRGALYGGALLALSILSLKIWRQGKSSLPFILGQAVLAASLLRNNLQVYNVTKRVFPTGLNIFISCSMLCFYLYVVMSGGNPPPKKLKSAAAAS